MTWMTTQIVAQPPSGCRVAQLKHGVSVESCALLLQTDGNGSTRAVLGFPNHQGAIVPAEELVGFRGRVLTPLDDELWWLYERSRKDAHR